MAGTQAARRNGSWPVALLNGGVGLVVLILVAVLALVVNPPAPPGIAAFAPQANKPITKAPNNQSSSFGDGAGECAAGQECEALSTTTTTAPSKGGKARGVPSALQCYTWPDGTVTQTFDPQSPPCIASWDDTKGNGGATSKGVTASEIKVAFPDGTTAPNANQVKPLVDFFNTRYQFYGRKITLVPYLSQQAEAQSTGTFNDPAMQRADATVVTGLNVFATTDFVSPLHYSWSLPGYLDIITRNKIIALNGGEMVPYGTTAELAARAPYAWTNYAPMDVLMRNMGRMVCRQLAGKPATHTSDTSLRGKTRKFAVFFPSDESLGGPMPGLDTLQQELAGCGVSAPVQRFCYCDRGHSATTTALMRQFDDDGVTSVFWFPQGGGGTPTHPWNLADSAGYQPEWLMLGWNNYQTAFELQNNTSQTANAFGLGVWNKQPGPEQEMWHRAYRAAGGDVAFINTGAVTAGRPLYAELLLLAAGIQMAGPNLTPESFAKGLQSTRFPNPGAAGPPFYQGRVGFTPGDVVMVDDMTQFWLDIRTLGRDVPSSPNNNTSRAMCYVNLGRRYTLDAWPTTDGYYAPGVCR